MAHRFVLGPADEGERVDKVVARRLVDVSRSTVQRWMDEGRVLLDGRVCRPRQAVFEGSVVDVEPGPPPATRVEPDATVEFDVIFEDEHLLVVDKPAGLVVHPGRGHRDGTLVAGLIARPGFERAPSDPRDKEGSLRPGIVHRIDKDTSGVLVVAKDARTREGLKSQLAAHSVERVYRALTLGVPEEGKIESMHGRHPTSRLRFTSNTDRGRKAVTHVRVDERLAGGRAALVTCRLETGRTHQIRVHLAERTRTPILADALYGRPPTSADLRLIAEVLGRQALHAETLGFVHPVTNERQTFRSPLPADVAGALAALRDLVVVGA